MNATFPWVCRRDSRSLPARVLGVFLVLALALVAASPASAQAAEDDLPGRVGRIADFAGQLYFSPPDRPAEWASIGINYPVTTGDNLWISGDGRAEVDYGGGQFRLAGDTNVHVSRLDDRQFALFVAQGRVVVRVRYLEPGETATVDTPNTQVQLTRTGLYRIDVGADRQETTATVREGEALVALAQGAQQVLPGQRATVRGVDATAAYVVQGVGIDGFDAWSADRDRYYERSRASAYVSRQMVGWAELDQYGSWQTYPEYGPVWFPTTVAVGWAPYSDGYWTSVGGWGWTWVDYAPWGYAPSHYGRWVSFSGRWGWCPGGYVARPLWAPALVGWYGGAAWGFSLSFGAPVYGWVPLGWRDPVRPWWGGGSCGERCWTHYNRPYGVRQGDERHGHPVRYSNLAVPGALTAVAGATLQDARPVPRNRVNVPPTALAEAPAMTDAPALKPALPPAARPGGRVPQPAGALYPATKPALIAVPPARAPVGGAADVAPPRPARRPDGPGAPGAPDRPRDTGDRHAGPPPVATPAAPATGAAPPAPGRSRERAAAPAPTLPAVAAPEPPPAAPASRDRDRSRAPEVTPGSSPAEPPPTRGRARERDAVPGAAGGPSPGTAPAAPAGRSPAPAAPAAPAPSISPTSPPASAPSALPAPVPPPAPRHDAAPGRPAPATDRHAPVAPPARGEPRPAVSQPTPIAVPPPAAAPPAAPARSHAPQAVAPAAPAAPHVDRGIPMPRTVAPVPSGGLPAAVPSPPPTQGAPAAAPAPARHAPAAAPQPADRAARGEHGRGGNAAAPKDAPPSTASGGAAGSGPPPK
jgi:hypothetical protein